jgi:hypothetical protein
MHVITKEEELEMPPPKKPKNIYVVSCKFKNVWANQFPWANMLRIESGEVHHVKCMVYSLVRGKKHGDWYVNKKCSHTKNEVAYSKKNCITIVEQVQGGFKGEWGREREHFVTILHLL